MARLLATICRRVLRFLARRGLAVEGALAVESTADVDPLADECPAPPLLVVVCHSVRSTLHIPGPCAAIHRNAKQ